MCHLAGYDVGVIEMLLMMSGDVEPNPGPGEWGGGVRSPEL